MESRERRRGDPLGSRAFSWPIVGLRWIGNKTFFFALSLSLLSLGVGAPPLTPGMPRVSAQGKDETKEKPESGAKTLLGAIPQDTLVCFRVGGTKGLLEKLKKSPFYGFKEEPAVKNLLGSLEAEIRGAFPEALVASGFDPLDLLGSAEGEWLVAVGNLDAIAAKLSQSLSTLALPDIKPEEFPVVVAFDAGDSTARVKVELERVFSYAEKLGFTRETSEVDGGKVTTLGEAVDSGDETKGERKEKGAHRSPWTFGELGSWFFAGPQREFLKSCMARMKGSGAGSLADDSRFHDSQKVLGRDSDLAFYLNLRQLASFLQSALSNSLFSFYWPRFQDTFIGKSSNSLAASLSLEERGMKVSAFLENGGASDGLCGLFRAESFSLGPPGGVPQDVDSYTTLAFSQKRLEEIVRAVGQTTISIMGSGGDPDAWFEKNLGVKLQDLAGALSGRAHVLEQGRGEGKTEPAMTLLLELSDGAPFKKLFEKLSEPSTGSLTAEKYKDHDVYCRKLYSGGPLTGGGPWCSVMGKMLAVVTVKDDLDKLYTAGSSSSGLSASEELQKAARGLPPKFVVFSFSSPGHVKRSLEGILRNGKLPGRDSPLLQGSRQLVEALGSCVSYMVWKEGGLFGEEWFLYKEK